MRIHQALIRWASRASGTTTLVILGCRLPRFLKMKILLFLSASIVVPAVSARFIWGVDPNLHMSDGSVPLVRYGQLSRIAFQSTDAAIRQMGASQFTRSYKFAIKSKSLDRFRDSPIRPFIPNNVIPYNSNGRMRPGSVNIKVVSLNDVESMSEIFDTVGILMSQWPQNTPAPRFVFIAEYILTSMMVPSPGSGLKYVRFHVIRNDDVSLASRPDYSGRIFVDPPRVVKAVDGSVRNSFGYTSRKMNQIGDTYPSFRQAAQSGRKLCVDAFGYACKKAPATTERIRNWYNGRQYEDESTGIAGENFIESASGMSQSTTQQDLAEFEGNGRTDDYVPTMEAGNGKSSDLLRSENTYNSPPSRFHGGRAAASESFPEDMFAPSAVDPALTKISKEDEYYQDLGDDEDLKFMSCEELFGLMDSSDQMEEGRRAALEHLLQKC